MTRNLAWTVVCTAALVACGGGGGGSGQLDPPPAPRNLEATPGDGVVGLRWDAVAGAEGYTVYWSAVAGVTRASGTGIHTQATTLNHADLENGVTYHYVVTAANAAGESLESAEASATPLPAYEPLTVARAGSGGGSVASAPAGIDCGASCAASFATGSSVSLNATSDATSTFDGWTGDCTGAGDCTVAMEAARSVTATFTRITHLLTVVRAGTGGGSVTSVPAGIDCGTTCEAAFDAGTAIVLTAAPDATSTFAGWSGACTGTGECTVSLDAAATAIATFTRITRALSVSRSGTGGGTVASSPAGIDCGASCEAGYDTGTVVELSATPDATSTFAGWTGACTGTASCQVTMDQARSVTATFTRITRVLAVAVSPGGTVTSAPAGIDCLPTCSAGYETGTSVTLTVHPANGGVFVGWGQGCSGASPTCTVTMDAARSVAAGFAYPLSVLKSGTGGGTVTSTPGLINCGTTCDALPTPGSPLTLTAAPDATSVFAGWTGAGCSGTGTCTVQMSAARSVGATFTRITYSLSITRTGGGTVTSSPAGIDCGIDCQESYSAGTPVTLTATSDAGATFAGWTGACAGTVPACTITMDAAKSVNAIFRYPLAVTRSGAGAGAVISSPAGINCGATCAASFDGGTAVTLAASGDAWSAFAGWSGACTGTGSCQVTMDQARSVDARFVGRPAIVSTAVVVPASSSTPQYVSVPLVVLDADPGESLTLSRVGDGTCPSQMPPPTFRVTSASIDSGTGQPVTVAGALEFLVGSGDAGTSCVYLSITDGGLESTKMVQVTVTP
jgi:uncharacterized repeat protein (TIGR02543 family)